MGLKIYCAYPIGFDCNLRCNYCFHKDRFETNYTAKSKFTFQDYCKWRDKFIPDAEDILVNFHGGEPFMDGPTNTMCRFLRNTTKERLDLLTNGLQNKENYAKLLPFKDRINRIGFTYHRKMIHGIEYYMKKYEENILFLKEAGVSVYVKELLFVEERDAILANKQYWRDKGVCFKIQDFKGVDKGKGGEEINKYEPIDLLYIDQEYRKPREYCECIKGYKNILIRGGWHDGDVLACFEDPAVIGNIQNMEYTPYTIIKRDLKKAYEGIYCVDVQGIPKIYKGTYEKDVYVPGSTPAAPIEGCDR